MASNECKCLLSKQKATMRKVAQVIGYLVAAFSAVQFGQLNYRELERQKSLALKANRGQFDSVMLITDGMKKDLHWWIHNIHSQYRQISHGNPQVTIQTDASSVGWGYVFENQKVGGRWSVNECSLHINVLELLAIKVAISVLLVFLPGKHVLIQSDSSTAVSYISKFGGIKSPECNKVAKEIWQMCIDNNIWLTCSHIPGVTNLADEPSRKFRDELEWSLSIEIFNKICNVWGEPKIDLFATRLNAKVPLFCSWKPDPDAKFIDCFTIDWSAFQSVYVFCPFSLLGRSVQKIQLDKARGIVIAPIWPTQQ